MQRVLPAFDALALLNTSSTRALERAAMAGLPPHALMERAGQAVARLALAIAPHARHIWVACGPGNNGGDGLVAARWLAQAGKQVRVSLLAPPDKLPTDAANALCQARDAGLAIHPDLSAPAQPFDLAIDALLGLGVSRAADGLLAAAIAALNRAPCPILAIDLPSGLDADTGQPMGACVNATHTLALLALKTGTFTGAGREVSGTLWFDGLGLDTPPAADAWLLGNSARAPWLRQRRHGQHKGSFGDVIVLGGACGMAGAAVLAARAAHAAGAGRVYLSTLDEAAPTIADINRPELMHMARQASQEPAQLAQRTVVCGCGGGEAVASVLPAVLAHALHLVLDADALNAIAADTPLQLLLADRATRGLQTVLTPHPLEAARLLGETTAQVQADRLSAATRLSQRFGCVAVLKGSGTVMAAPGQLPSINASGNAALATAGTGDVLAGWLGGLWAQQPGSGLDAACAAVYWHGLAADQSRLPLLRAADLVEQMFALHG